MTEFIKEYADLLKTQYKTYKYDLPLNTFKNNKAAVIVEPRKHDILIETINNVMLYLGSSWNLHVITHDTNIEWLRDNFVNIDILNINQKNLVVNEHDDLFKSESFWNSFNEEHILIFQTDSCIMNRNMNINDFLHYPFIGGYYYYCSTPQLLEKNEVAGYVSPINIDENKILIQLHNSPHLNFSINGGFSLRHRSKMIECIQKVDKNIIIQQRNYAYMCNTYYEKCTIGEDSFFQNALDFLGYILPTKKECSLFCENLSCLPEEFNKNALGVHNTNKQQMMSIHGKSVIHCLRDTI
jgi:hypothetical protein